jgi:hypothetical protein
VIAALARPSVARLVRTPRAWAIVGAWCALALALAISARTQGVAHGADRVLLDAYGAIVLPLLAFGLVGSLVGSRSLSANLAPLNAYGAPPVLTAATTLGVALVPTVALGAVLAALVAIVAHGSGDPPVARDALASAYAGALGGMAYASLFALGSSFGRRGGGRALLLVADWLLGAAGGVTSLLTPRAHLRNLLGGTAPMDLSGGASAAVLVLLTVAYLGATLARSRR